MFNYFQKIQPTDTFKEIAKRWIFFELLALVPIIIGSVFFPVVFKGEENVDALFLISMLLSPFWETLVFFYLPYRFGGLKAGLGGTIIWILLHSLNSIANMVNVGIISFFYYRLMEAKKWKELILFHFITNFIVFLILVISFL